MGARGYERISSGEDERAPVRWTGKQAVVALAACSAFAAYTAPHSTKVAAVQSLYKVGHALESSAAVTEGTLLAAEVAAVEDCAACECDELESLGVLAADAGGATESPTAMDYWELFWTDGEFGSELDDSYVWWTNEELEGVRANVLVDTFGDSRGIDIDSNSIINCVLTSLLLATPSLELHHSLCDALLELAYTLWSMFVSLSSSQRQARVVGRELPVALASNDLASTLLNVFPIVPFLLHSPEAIRSAIAASAKGRFAQLVVVAPAPEAEKSNAPVADSSASVESKTTDPLQGRARVRSPPTLAALGTFVVLVVALASYLTARVATARRVDGGYDGVKLLCFEMSFDWRFEGNGAIERWEDDWTTFDPDTGGEKQVGATGIANLDAQIIRRRLREGAAKHGAVVTTLGGRIFAPCPRSNPTTCGSWQSEGKMTTTMTKGAWTPKKTPTRPK